MSNILQIEASYLIPKLRQIYVLVKDIGEKEVLESSSVELQVAFKRLDELTALEVDEGIYRDDPQKPGA